MKIVEINLFLIHKNTHESIFVLDIFNNWKQVETRKPIFYLLLICLTTLDSRFGKLMTVNIVYKNAYDVVDFVIYSPITTKHSYDVVGFVIYSPIRW